MFTFNKKLLVLAVLTGLTLWVYWPVFNFQFINFDDGGYVFHNLEVQGPITLKKIFWAFTTTQMANWHPLTWLSYIFDYQLFGLNAGGYHLTNFLFHLANSILLFLLLEKMTKSLWLSALTAALFAVHPLHIESVAWIAERKDVLSGFFWILSIIAYVFYVKRPSTGKYLLVLLSFICGLMAKPMVVTLPVVLLLLDFWPLRRFSIGEPLMGGEIFGIDHRKKFSFLLLEKLPLLFFSIASSVMTYYAQQSYGAVNQSIPLMSRLSNTLISYISYLIKMFWPVNLSIYYPYTANFPFWQIIISVLILAAIFIVAILKINRYPYLAVGWLWFLGTMVPVIGLIQVGFQAMADRYTYIPYIGIFIMVTWGGADLVTRWTWRRIFVGFTIGISLLVLSIIARIQVGYWENTITLFRHALHVSANNYKAHDILGFALMEEGRLDEAVCHFQEAIRLRPNYGSAYNNIGVVLEKKGMIQQAETKYREAIRVQPGNANAHYNLGVLLYGQGKIKEAKDHFLMARQVSKNYAEAYNNLSVILLNEGRIEEAISQAGEALKIKPTYADAHYNLANALACSGRINEAIEHYQEALRIQPKYEKALNNLGLAKRFKDKPDEVIDSFRRGLIILPPPMTSSERRQ